ncbi:hypothetical protein CONLIGDRAFT_651513 [Coniochaeta ligniaria NRRL 30616]|uniref:Uncharacterized protein n=1 Tax=Coniochaeta ligniaria NRRL 30616 TaxID=1408157 RepID=A0A1J7J6T5_9PEZI|nr:hypothetical protein CONLIGDRAFT_651513 [Coniochaeta ligniaria NRRL 30616]
MALTVKHINDDASFLLSFEPLITDPRTGPRPEPFRILLDPWITGPSTVLHPKMSVTHQKHQACVTSLAELPEPDLVIISQHIPDHCNEATLRQLPATGTKTIILAEPTSARTIRGWKYFDKAKVQTIPKWDDWGPKKGENIVRIPLEPVIAGGEPGEVTVAFIPQRKDMMGLHSAVGITYRPPTTSPSTLPAGGDKPLTPGTPVWTPPASPTPRKSYTNLTNLFSSSNHNPASGELSPASPTSPGIFSLRSARSASSLPRSISSYFTTSTAATSTATTPNSPPPPDQPQPTSSPPTQPVLSLLFSPHGISPPSLQSYATSHLSPLSALPLTALLHCFDTITNPWWLGGEILLGAPVGAVTAARLGARVWIGAHDGDKEVGGLANGLLRTRRWSREEVVAGVGRSCNAEERG